MAHVETEADLSGVLDPGFNGGVTVSFKMGASPVSPDLPGQVQPQFAALMNIESCSKDVIYRRRRGLIQPRPEPHANAMKSMPSLALLVAGAITFLCAVVVMTVELGFIQMIGRLGQ